VRYKHIAFTVQDEITGAYSTENQLVLSHLPRKGKKSNDVVLAGSLWDPGYFRIAVAGRNISEKESQKLGR
jgi:hypothetical protein